MSEAGESVGRQTPTHQSGAPIAKPHSVVSDGSGAVEQVSFRPGMQSFPRPAIGEGRPAMGEVGRPSIGEFPHMPRERRLSGFSGMSTPEHKYHRRTPFQMEYSSRRSYNGSAGGASSFQPLFTPGSVRAGSVASNGSRESFQQDNRDAPLPDDPDQLKQKIKDNWQLQDNMRAELNCKKEEVLQLRQKVMDLKQELAAVNTSKSVLNEACVTGMMDVFALNSHISQLQGEKDALEQANEQLRRESVDHDHERRGLLSLLEDTKTSLEQKEEYLDVEVKRRKEVEQSRTSLMERLDLELKWVQREVHEKTIKLKKLAKTNEKLARKLLSLETDNSEIKGIAKLLQKQNQQLDGENQELSGCIMQLEQQIVQLAKEKQEVDHTMEVMREEHSQRLESEKSALLSKMEKLERELKEVKEKQTEDDIAALKAQNEKVTLLEEEKLKMEDRVKSLSTSIESLKEEQKLQEESAAQVRVEYIQKLEEDTQALRSRVLVLERSLDEARASESETTTAHKQTKAQIELLEEEKVGLDAQVKSYETQISELQGRLDSNSDAHKRIKAQELMDLIEEKEELECKLESIEKQLQDMEAQKQASDEMIRKLKQEIRDCEQQKSTLAHQVNVLEWHLSGLYAEKQEALRTLEDRNLELIRLQQDLADKEEDLEQAKKENVEASKAVVVRTRELKATHFARESETEEMRQRNKELEEENDALRAELERLRGKVDDSKKVQPSPERKQRRTSFMNVSLEFRF